MCSCSLIQAQDRAQDEPCFAPNMLCNLLKPNAFPLPLAFPPRRNRVDAALSMLSVSHMGCGETKANYISKETYSSHCQEFPGKKKVEQRSTSNVQQCQGKKPRRWPEQPAFVSPSLPNGCAVLGTRVSLEAATFSLRIFRPFCAYLYYSKNRNCHISLVLAILPCFSWGYARFQMKRCDLSRLDLADLAQTDCCGQPCRSDWDSSLLNLNVFSNALQLLNISELLPRITMHDLFTSFHTQFLPSNSHGSNV